MQLKQFVDTGQKNIQFTAQENILKQDTVKIYCARIVLKYAFYGEIGVFSSSIYTLIIPLCMLIPNRWLADVRYWLIAKHEIYTEDSKSPPRIRCRIDVIIFFGITYTAVFLWQNMETNIWDGFVYLITKKILSRHGLHFDTSRKMTFFLTYTASRS